MFRSEAAFAEIIRRHERLVYAVALREVGDRQSAEDVTQAVFLILAQRAPSLWRHTTLTGWLFHTARLAGKSALRQERRRRQREHTAAAQALDPVNTCPPDDTLRLNEALSALRPHEREALLLRFFDEASFSEVGAALGVSEDTAQKRVSRALDKMRAFLTKSQDTYALSVANLVGLLSAEAAQSVPRGCGEAVLHVLPGLKITLGTGSLLCSRAHQISQGVIRIMKAKSFAKAAAVCAVAGLSISALWAGNGSNKVIAGTWRCQNANYYSYDRGHKTHSNRLIMQMVYNPNGTFTGKLVSMAGKPSLPAPGVFLIAGKYTLSAFKKTDNTTSARLSTTIIQEMLNGKPILHPQSSPPQTITLSGDGKTMTIVDQDTITSAENGEVTHKISEEVWHRQ